MFRVNNPAYSLPVIAALLLAGCSLPEGEFPSLAKRSYETSDPVSEPSAEPKQLTTALPADVTAAVNLLLARHQKAESAFRSNLEGVRKAAQSAAGSAIGSESWVSAEVELSRLDVARGDSVAALAELDKLITNQRDLGADSGLLGLLAEPQSRVAADVAAQTAEIEALARLIG
jgi:hypothetical protein